MSLSKGMIIENTYEIIEEIGAGGGGIVYKAIHMRLNTYVAVKKIKDEVMGKINLRREADILKNLKHPYLPRVYDFIETQDGVYTVMDFIEGENLDDAVKRYGKFEQRLVMKWAEQLGEALAYLHSQKPPIIHSDIKPANIILSSNGNICLIDFNISLALGENKEGVIGTSAGFSPPEQYRDPGIYLQNIYNYRRKNSVNYSDTTEVYNSDKTVVGKQTDISDSAYVKFLGKGIDERSDIYSLGMTLCYLLNGKKIIDFDDINPISQTAVVSEGFAAIIDKMIEISPDKRYQNGGQFLKSIRNCHKLDKRYIIMRRKQTLIQAGAIVSLFFGIFIIWFGLHRLEMERDEEYYNCLSLVSDEIENENFKEAQDLLEDAKLVDETKIEAYEREIYLLYINEDYKDCIETGEYYIKTAPYSIETDEDTALLSNIYYIIGNSYYEEEDYSNARTMLGYALEYNKQSGVYYRDYAIILAKLGKVEDAREELEKAIKKGIEQDSINMVEGEIAYMEGQYNETVEYMKQVIAVTNDKQMKKRAVYLCVDACKAQGSPAIDTEISILEQEVGQFEDNLVMKEYLADAYVRKASAVGENSLIYYQKALTLFNSIYESGYVTYQIQENMVIIYENMDDFDNAQKLLNEMVESYPDDYKVYKRLAFLEADKQQNIENASRNYGKMQEYYEMALEKYSPNSDDSEMDMLANMMQEIKNGGWIK